MAALESTGELSRLLDKWTNERPSGETLLDLLKKIAAVLEEATETYFKQDPDPFDERHPCRSVPNCAFGHMLKKIVKSEDFMAALSTEYLHDSAGIELNIVSCRIFLDLTPGLDIDYFASKEGFVDRFIMWSERATNPLRSYSTAILAVLLDHEDVARNYKEKTVCLASIMVERLQDLSVDYFKTCKKKEYSSLERPFAHLNKVNSESSLAVSTRVHSSSSSPSLIANNAEFGSSSKSTFGISELSSSSWSDVEPLMIGSHQVYPLTLADEQRYILQYLSSIADYPELMACMYSESRKSSMPLLLKYTNLNEQPNVRLSFDALKLIAVLLTHKKCALDFISKENIETILSVQRPSLAATGVSYVLLYLSFIEDVMKKICLLPRYTIWNLVSYGLWLLECSHATGRANAVGFFGSALQHDVIQVLFFDQDGLRKLLNVMSTLDVVVHNVNRSNRSNLSADSVTSGRQVCRHVCTTMKKLYEAFAESRVTTLLQSQPGNSKPGHRSTEENMEILKKHVNPDHDWDPIDQLLNLDGISLLLKIIVINFDWNNSGKLETVKSALDVLFVCSMSNKVKLALCEPVSFRSPLGSAHYQEVTRRPGMSIILQVAHGDVLIEGDVRCSALNIIVNCVCRYSVVKGNPIGKKNDQKSSHLNTDEVMNRIWNCVRLNSGIMVLCGLLSVKSPVTDADAIRCLACQALCGLANCPKVMQIISNLPLIANCQLQVLMQEPVLRDKRQEHAKFISYGKKLMEMVVGRSLDINVSNLKKADIVYETIINYDEKQLLQLIADHLYEKGYCTTAQTLIREAGLQNVSSCSTMHFTSSKNSKDERFGMKEISADDCNTLSKNNFRKSHCVSLDTIVSEYLRNQHASCKNPYVTCPPFDLFTPHQCFEPSFRNVLPNNISVRHLTKQYCPSYWGKSGAGILRKYLSSRFQETRVLSSENEVNACAFLSPRKICLGTSSGEVKIFSLQTGEKISSFQAHENLVSNVQSYKDSPLILTSQTWRRNVSCLWNTSQNHQLLHSLNEESYAEFSKLNQDRIIGTYRKRARIYDVETGALILTLDQPGFGNFYRFNKATFNHTDNLVLSDGVIWDVRSAQVVHKLDKFNSKINGVFHPNSVEIVSNSEIWDARTYELLKTVPELENCKIVFDSSGDVIYGAIMLSQIDNLDDPVFKRYGSSFRSFDASDYTCIATRDTHKAHVDLAIDSGDIYLAILEKVLGRLLGKDSVCHIYSIGWSKEVDDSDDGDEDDDSDDQLDDLDDESQGIHQTDEEEEEEDGQQNEEAEDHAETDRETNESSSSGESSSSTATDSEFYFSFVS